MFGTGWPPLPVGMILYPLLSGYVLGGVSNRVYFYTEGVAPVAQGLLAQRATLGTGGKK